MIGRINRRSVLSSIPGCIGLGLVNTASAKSDESPDSALEDMWARYRFEVSAHLGDEVLIDQHEFVEGSIINHAKGGKVELSVRKMRDGEVAGRSTFPSSISSIMQESFVEKGENYIRSVSESGKRISDAKYKYTDERNNKLFTKEVTAELVEYSGPAKGGNGRGTWLIPTYGNAFGNIVSTH